MTTIREDDLIQSIADAFQYISYYHPLDYIRALGAAYEREESPAARVAVPLNLAHGILARRFLIRRARRIRSAAAAGHES